MPQAVAETAQLEDEPSEGIDTSSSTSRLKQVLWTHQQHVADYVYLMVEAGISLPMGEDKLVPLIMEVLPFFFLFVISHVILYLTSGFYVEFCYSFIHHYFLSSFRPSRKYM